MVVFNDCNPGHFTHLYERFSHVPHSGLSLAVSTMFCPDMLLTTIMQIPLTAWLAAFRKVIYDRELAVSERSVKPASILHNSSLILGKQIIHILPEGYVNGSSIYDV